MDLGKSSVEISIAKKKKELVELVSKIKAKGRFKGRTELERLALKIARRLKDKQIIYGSVASSAYARTIKPRDIDIATKKPYKAARQLLKEALKKKIKAELKKKYIRQIKANIYEVNSVSYSPMQKSKLKHSMVRYRIRQTTIPKEVSALAATIARARTQYRAKRDYLKLRRIKQLLEKKQKQRYQEIIKRLKKQGESYFLDVIKEQHTIFKKKNAKWL